VKKPAPILASPKMEEREVSKEERTPPNVTPLQEATLLTESPAEKARLELLNQQLSMEYRRLADTQERNIALEKQLKATKEAIAGEHTRLDEERKRLEEQQVTFLGDKKRLEDHLSARLREMKEQMRKNEELNKAHEEEIRAKSESERQEERQLAETARLAEKEARREYKVRVNAEKKAVKAVERERDQQSVREMENEYHGRLREAEAVIAQLRDTLARSDSEVEALQRQLIFNKAQSESQHQQASVTNLQSVVSWLSKAVEDLQTKDNITPANIRHEMLESLRGTL